MRQFLIVGFLFMTEAFGLCLAGASAQQKSAAPTYLDQGWTADDRERFYFTPQGSELIPLEWFKNLETKEGHKLFRTNENLDRLRFVVVGATERNPDGLPVGFVNDADIDPTQTSAKLAILERKFKKKADPNDKKAWLGLTCAACHTNRIEFGNKVIQVDGAPSMADLQMFLSELADALESTVKDGPKLLRFARALKLDNTPAFKAEVASHAEALRDLVERNKSTHRYGFARLDAFGAILNAVCDAALEIPGNNVESSAPVSYPFLWYTPQMDWVQWNSSSNIPLARNVGEVLGVFGFFSLKTGEGNRNQFDSTVKLKSLLELESLLQKLKAPIWPEEIFGKLDSDKVAKGRALFVENCAVCHQVRDAQGNYKTVKMGNEQRILTHALPLSEIKTDPQMILNLAKPAEPGVLKDFLPEALRDCSKVSRAILLSATVGNVTKNRAQTEMHPLTQNPAAGLRPPLSGAGYKSRPLEGIWATAPFLHNGSVPNLYELLLPSAKRSKSFYVGSRKFDPTKVGFSTDAGEGLFEFKVFDGDKPIPGNSHAGHEGHRYTEVLRNGEWREFDDSERWALVEYMKAMGHPVAAGDASPPATAEVIPGLKITETEQIAGVEAKQIDNVVALTIQQLKNRYGDSKPILRGVHAKDHGCVKAVVDVVRDLGPDYRVGVFAEPGKRYESMIRFSNASTLVLPDNPEKGRQRVFGSRGMAIKLLNVEGTPLLPPNGPLAQDFLLVNHPVFAFPNVEDYEVLSTILADTRNGESPDSFFPTQIAKGGIIALRALKSLQIVRRIQAPTVGEGAFQPQPATPLDCRYFSGAAFQFGEGFVAKFAATPIDPPSGVTPDIAEPDYLRKGLISRLAPKDGAKPVVFQLQVQRRAIKEIDVAIDIEDACTEWSECRYPFVTVATITIQPQEFDSPEHRAACEALIFTPWNGVKELRPLGGINRMRRAVYEASSKMRHPAPPAAN